jgi:hypothetical protein
MAAISDLLAKEGTPRPRPGGGGAVTMSTAVGQLIRQRSNYDFGVARILALRSSLAEIVRPSGERQQRNIGELEPAVLAPTMVCRLDGCEELCRIIAVFGTPQEGLRLLHVEGIESSKFNEALESAIVDLVPATDPVERLLSLDHRGRHTLTSRESLLHAYLEVHSNCRGLENLAGARIELLPHQIMTAQRVLSLAQPRALLCDEAGLGKTIECGMVLSVLSRAPAELRVLVLCSGALCLQWLGEMYSRFQARVFALIDHHPPANLPGLPRLIVSFAALAQSEALRRTLFELPWDVVVIDEAHRIAGSPLFDFLQQLAGRTPGLLLLSPPPPPSRTAEAARLLSLLDAPRKPIADRARLEKLRPLAQSIAALARETAAASAATLIECGKRWLELIGEDPTLRALCADLGKKGRAAARDKLLRHVAEWYGIDSRVIANRRAALLEALPMAPRTLSTRVYEPSAAERRVMALTGEWCALLVKEDGPKSPHAPIGRFLGAHALQFLASGSGALAWLIAQRREGLKAGAASAATLAIEAGFELPLSQLETRQLLRAGCQKLPLRANEKKLLTSLEEALLQWAEDEQRLQAVCQFVMAALDDKPRDKILLFAEQPETLSALSQRLSAELTRKRLRVATLHVGMAPEERERAAYHFTHVDSTAVLLCDQLGGEGRSFAVARHVAHVDLPWDLHAIEKRIGRLDRLDRKDEVRIFALCSDHAVEQSFAELLWRRLLLGQQRLSGLEFLAEELQREFAQHAVAGDAAALLRWLEAAGARISAERQPTDSAAVLEQRRFALEDGEELIEELSADSTLDCKLLGDWAKKADIQIKPTRDLDTFDIDVGGQTRKIAAMNSEKLRGTTDRAIACKSPALQFLTWGHPLVEALHRDAADYAAARCTHVVHKDDESRTWRGCRVRVIIRANPQHQATLPAALRGRVSYIARPMEETLFVRGDGEVESAGKSREWLESAFLRSHKPDFLALGADAALHERFVSEVRTAAEHAVLHVQKSLVPIFVAPAEELAADEELAACRSRASNRDPRFAAAPAMLAAALVEQYEQALRSIREPLVEIDNISFLEIVPRPVSSPRL